MSLRWLQQDIDPGLTRFYVIPARGVVGSGAESFTRLRDAGVAARHFLLEQRKDAVVLRDLGTPAGTWVNGRLVAEVELQPGDQIRAGAARLTFRAIPSRSTLTRRRPIGDNRGKLRETNG